MNGKMVRGGLGLALAAALAMSGCAGEATSAEDGGAKPAAAPTADATAALAAAAAKLQEQTFKSTVAMGSDGTLTGVTDPKQNTGEYAMEGETDGTKFKTEIRVVGGVTYMRMTMAGMEELGFDGKTWRKMKGGGGPGTLGEYDAADTVRSLKSATEVKWAGDNAVTGVIDLAKSGKQLGMGSGDINRLTVKTIPFRAGFDGTGRLTSYTFTIPAIGSEPATKMDIKYGDFGIPVDIKAPTGAELKG